MPLHALTDDQRRGICRTTIEALELWLRRLIHNQLTAAYGVDYLNAKLPSAQNVINTSIRRDLACRQAQEPGRFPRPIDAAMLDSEISIICNPNLYTAHFSDALGKAFPDGHEEARTFLNRLIGPRNNLSHANPISVRQAEQVLCYSRDVIDSLKHFYRRTHMDKEYDTPTFLLVKDSLGNVIHESQMIRTANGKIFMGLQQDRNCYLRPGDSLSLEVEVDSSYSKSDYVLEWSIGGIRCTDESSRSEQIVLQILPKHVTNILEFACRIRTNRDWHKYGVHDDLVQIFYKVLPPIA